MRSYIRLIALGIVACAPLAHAGNQTIDYVNWYGQDGGLYGTLANGAISVNYNGEINFAQLNNSGTYFYTDQSQVPGSGTEYTSNPVIANTPSTSDMIAVTGDPNYLDTISFSQPVTDPVMLLVSLGNPGQNTQYNFDTPFTLLSDGPGWWGGPGILLQSGNTLTGIEGDGAIEFVGTYTSISWTGDNAESWNGFTFGVPTSAPDGASTLTLLAGGLFGLTLAKRKIFGR